MKQRPLQWNVFRDDGGQALTEFVIVIPIILLLFFAMLQYFAVVQAAQLGNYAAFCAARVYAVRASVDANDAQDKAETAAALVLAPIARPVPGEIGGATGLSSVVGGAMNGLQSILGNNFANFLTGYAMAKYVRLNSSLLGGSVTITKQGTPTQVDVTINYPQPVFIPGLAGLWNFVTGDKIYYSMKSLRQGLSGVPSYILPVYETADQAQQLAQLLAQFDPSAASSISSIASSLPTVMLPYINVQSKCSIGYSGWSGAPRLPDDTDDTSGTDTNLSNTAQNVQDYQKANSNYTNAVNAAKIDCQSVTQACNKVTADKATISQISAIPEKDRTQAQKNQLSAAQSDLPTQEGNLSTAQGNLTNDQANVKTYADQVNQDQSQLNSAVQQQGGSTANSFQPMAESIDCPACNN